MKITWRTELLPVFFIVASFVMAAIAWPQAPDRIPIHWGINGQPNNYAGKTGLFYPAFIALGIYVLLLVLPRIDPRRRNYARFWGTYTFIRTAVIAALVCIELFTVLWAMDVKVDINIAVPIVVGALLMVLGNFLGKIRPNWFAGIRTPWTLSSTESWNKTHRLGGRLLALVGLLVVIAAVVHQTWSYILAAVAAGVIIIVLVVYSYLIWKRDPDAGPAGRLPDPGERGSQPR